MFETMVSFRNFAAGLIHVMLKLILITKIISSNRNSIYNGIILYEYYAEPEEKLNQCNK